MSLLRNLAFVQWHDTLQWQRERFRQACRSGNGGMQKGSLCGVGWETIQRMNGLLNYLKSNNVTYANRTADKRRDRRINRKRSGAILNELYVHFSQRMPHSGVSGAIQKGGMLSSGWCILCPLRNWSKRVTNVALLSRGTWVALGRQPAMTCRLSNSLGSHTGWIFWFRPFRKVEKAVSRRFKINRYLSLSCKFILSVILKKRQSPLVRKVSSNVLLKQCILMVILLPPVFLSSPFFC